MTAVDCHCRQSLSYLPDAITLKMSGKIKTLVHAAKTLQFKACLLAHRSIYFPTVATVPVGQDSRGVL